MSVLKKIMLGIVVLLVLAGAGLGVAAYLTRDLVQIIEKELVALRQGHLTEAYSYTSKDFQRVTPLAEFKQLILRYPALFNNVSGRFYDREIHKDEGTVKGKLTAQNGVVTPIVFDLVKEEGVWKIITIQVDPASTATHPPTAPGTVELSEQYRDAENKFTIKFPSDWVSVHPGRGTVLFSGKKGTPAYYSTVNIQTVLAKGMGGRFATAEEFLSDLKKQSLTQDPALRVLEEGPFELHPGAGIAAQGRYAIFTYHYKGEAFKQWQIVLLRGDVPVFYAWAYTAPVSEYDATLPVAQAMLNTWTIMPSSSDTHLN